ncbi:efflux RND transporter periplasmic adaptor subunit [Embleya sp. NBC_00896]|uniref:efflux RND transporter periplasmic adaptor subunit n=1 Tax=Embleya sp. NBC_00896 TaxID=2975961 RepID=UPI002F90E91D|nr:efflux RND transporter periplasmic adaptor subunit [Embleya sp. NBC_00896]
MTSDGVSIRRHRRRAARVCAVAIAASAVGGIAWFLILGPERGTDDRPARVARTSPTKTVTRGDLVATFRTNGRLGYAGTYRIVGGRAGTVTWVPRPGQVIERGHSVYALDQRPVPLMFGGVPFYRDLSPGSEGADVRQLEENLLALGFTTADELRVDEAYTTTTARVVERWQHALGVDETGSLAAGDAVVAPGALRVGAVEPLVGQSTQRGQAVVAGTGTGHSVRVDVPVERRSFVREGQSVSILLPGSRTVRGRVDFVGTAADPVSAGTGDGAPSANRAATPGCQGAACGGQVAVEIAVTASESELGGLTEGSASVTFAADTRRDVLSVPVEALTASPEGGFAVTVVDASGQRSVPVQTGLFASGRVEVSGPGIDVGIRVQVPTP